MKVSSKKIKKYAGKAIKKVPKKKIINKAATYGVKQLIGGPYLDIATVFYNKTKKKALSYAGVYAYESFFRSKFAREKINTIPMSVVSMITRTIANFLVFSRLRTGYHWFDFIMSMIITVLITVFSPFFYTSVKAHEESFMKYTNIFVDNFLGPNGWEYVENIKNRIVLALGITVLIILQFVEINSRYLQELIIHTLITGYVSDQILQWIENLPKIRVFYTGMESIQPQYIVPAILPYRKAKLCHTKNRVFRELKPLKALFIPHDKIGEHVKNKSTEKRKYVPMTLSIIEDYSDTPRSPSFDSSKEKSEKLSKR